MLRGASWHSTVAAVLGGAAVAGDFLPPFVGPAVDLAAGAAVAMVAVDAALTVAGENDSRMAARDIVVMTVRAAKLDAYSTPAAAVLELTRSVLELEQPSALQVARLAGRSLLAGARSLVGRKILKVVPGARTVARVIGCGHAAREAARLVSGIEQAAARALADYEPSLTPLPRRKASVTAPPSIAAARSSMPAKKLTPAPTTSEVFG
jgi:hypothetical protein